MYTSPGQLSKIHNRETLQYRYACPIRRNGMETLGNNLFLLLVAYQANFAEVVAS